MMQIQTKGGTMICTNCQVCEVSDIETRYGFVCSGCYEDERLARGTEPSPVHRSPSDEIERD
jgi:hypothetical protein